MKNNQPNRREVSKPHDADAANTLNSAKIALGTLSDDFAVTEYARLGAAVMRYDLPVDCAMAINAQLIKAALATVEGLGLKDELEAMLAVQMVATHALGMRMMERASAARNWGESQLACNFANKLMRTFAAQTEALAKLRRDGEQIVRVEHVNVLPGGQAVVGNVTHQTITGGGMGKMTDKLMQRKTEEPLSLQQSPRCGARTRQGRPCQSPAANGKGRCRMHGGAKGSGAPCGSRNGNYRNGRFTQKVAAERRLLSAFIGSMRASLKSGA